jgi:hypothetical protein
MQKRRLHFGRIDLFLPAAVETSASTPAGVIADTESAARGCPPQPIQNGRK